MKRLLVLLTVLLLVLSGCRQGTEGEPETATTLPILAEEQAGDGSIIFLVDNALDRVFLTAAENFAQRIAQISGGEVQVTVRSRFGAGAGFAAEDNAFAFLDSTRHRSQCAYFDAVSTPFLYSDLFYLDEDEINGLSYTMTVNDTRVLSMLEQDMLSRIGARPLAGFYQPGSQLLTTWQTVNQIQFSRAETALKTDGPSLNSFRLLGADITEIEEPQDRIRWVLEGGQGAEATLEDLAAFDWDDPELYRDPELDLYLTLSCHDISPVWLAVKEELYSGLSPKAQAAIQEAVAYMFHDIDDVFWEREGQQLRQLQQKGLLVSDDFANARRQVYAMESSQEAAQRFMMNIVDEFG